MYIDMTTSIVVDIPEDCTVLEAKEGYVKLLKPGSVRDGQVFFIVSGAVESFNKLGWEDALNEECDVVYLSFLELTHAQQVAEEVIRQRIAAHEKNPNE